MLRGCLMEIVDYFDENTFEKIGEIEKKERI